MTATEVSSLTIQEKFQLMEQLWMELRSRVETAGIPAEHKRLLDERRRKVEAGESQLHEWDQVKHTIGRR
jgi:putative addiction module component (TIGR02574 family)